MKYIIEYGLLYLVIGAVVGVKYAVEQVLSGRIDADDPTEDELMEIGKRVMAWPKYLREGSET